MATRADVDKVQCLNPNTGGSMKIDKQIYDLFSKTILQTLKKEQPLTYTQIVEGIQDRFRRQQTKFDGSIEWYAVTVKHDMHARGVIEVFNERGKNLHRLKQR